MPTTPWVSALPFPALGRDEGYGGYALAGEFSIEMTAEDAEAGARIVREGIAETDDYRRWHRFAHLHEPGFLAPLRAALRQAVSDGQAADLVQGIASIDTLPATAALIELVDDPRPSVQTAALRSLVWRMPRRQWTAESAQTPEQRESARLRAAILAQTWDEQQAGNLRTRLASRLAAADQEVCLAAIEVLGELGGPDAVETLARTANAVHFSPRFFVRPNGSFDSLGKDRPGRGL